MEKTSTQTAATTWKPLYRTGAIAPLVALALYLSEFALMIFGEPYPRTIEEWYALAQRSKLLALWYLNSPDMISFALLGVMFLALYVALRHVHPSRMLIALYFAVLGAVTFIVPRALHLALLPLSDLHAAATSEAQRTMYLAAGEGLSRVSAATPETLGFLFMAVAGLIVSLVILQSRSFGHAPAYVGIVGFVATLADFTARLIAPAIAPILMPINGLLWFAWWILISVGLFRLAGASRGIR
jgi:hypothetical protein